MFVSHKSNIIQQISELEWDCRRNTKGQTKAEYRTWLDSVTSGDPPVVDLSGETGYTIVECTDEGVEERLNQLGDYVSNNIEGITYNIKYYTAKRDAEEIKDVDGDSHDPKQYVQSHFVGQDSTRDARFLAEQWTRIRAERDRLLTGCDWTQNNDSPCTAIDKSQWKTYRQELRDIPKEQSSAKTYEDITWPSSESI